MSCFATIDIAASYWRGDTGPEHQTERMVGFMRYFSSTSEEAAFISIKMRQHTLMHTSRPRVLLYRDKKGKKDEISVDYSWLMHWSSLLHRDDHLRVKRLGSPSEREIQLALAYLIEDIISALDKMAEEAASNLEIQRNIETAQSAISRKAFSTPEYISKSSFK